MTKWTRRHFFQGTAAAGVAATLGGSSATAQGADDDPAFTIKNGRIRQSVMGWCFKPMPVEELARHCKALGMHAMEGVSTNAYPFIRKLGLEISLCGSHGFKKGPCDPANHDACIAKIREGIDRAVGVGCKSVITFTGMRVKGLTDEQQDRNCLKVFKAVIGYAEEKSVNLVLEHLNSRDDTHPMKGHPGYFGDDVDHCVDLIRKVDSPRMKLLFDIYHVQIMNGDVIRRIRQYKDVIGHYHTAGVPGRGELDESQELNYPPILRTIVETGYKGFVAQEFIPTKPDTIATLRHAVRLCDV